MPRFSKRGGEVGALIGIERKMMKIKAFGCISLVLVVFLVAGVPELADAYSPTSEDNKCIDWFIETTDKINEDRNSLFSELDKCLDEDDCERCKSMAIEYHTHVDNALNELKRFKASPEFEPIKNECNLWLIDAKKEAQYILGTVECHISDDIVGEWVNLSQAIEYENSSIEHHNKTRDLVNELPPSRDYKKIVPLIIVLLIIGWLKRAFFKGLFGRK